jgi:hypothetical protein
LKYKTKSIKIKKKIDEKRAITPRWEIKFNSKTVNNIKNLTRGKNDQHIKIYLPCNFEVNLITHLGVIALFSSNL